jgi:hypothetical protein
MCPRILDGDLRLVGIQHLPELVDRGLKVIDRRFEMRPVRGRERFPARAADFTTSAAFWCSARRSAQAIDLLRALARQEHVAYFHFYAPPNSAATGPRVAASPTEWLMMSLRRVPRTKIWSFSSARCRLIATIV